MTIESELVFDREPTSAVMHVRWMAAGIGAACAIAVVLAVFLASEPTTQEGVQATPTGSIALEQAEVDGWELLAPVAGELRVGFPAPMVWKDDRICIGFARIDFGPDDLRPGTARCERNRPEVMAPNEIRSLLTIKSGFDTWHFVEAPEHIESLKVRLATGKSLGNERVHLSGSTAALRLEHGRDLASIEWTVSSLTYRCVPDPTAWTTSEFCVNGVDE